jgi:hypothetical protein
MLGPGIFKTIVIFQVARAMPAWNVNRGIALNFFSQCGSNDLTVMLACSKVEAPI